MIRIDGVYAELRADDVELLAGFYERTLGFERIASTPGSCVLAAASLYVRITAPFSPVTEQEPFCLAVAPATDLEAVRDEVIAGGAIVLSESKRDGMQRLVCQDPAGNELVIVQRPEVRALSPAEVSSATNQAATDRPVSSGTSRSAIPRVTRRDVDRLRDSERLAGMQEAIAGLHVAFDPGDPAAVMDEMRAKIGPDGSIESAKQMADEALRIEQRAAEAADILNRYRAALTNEPEPARTAPRVPTVEPEPAHTAPGVPAVEPDEDNPVRDVLRTLGRSKDEDDDPRPG